jgi:hypothetical protein
MKRKSIVLLSVAAGWFSIPAHSANAPCDANVPVKGCRAEVKVDGKFVVLKSNTPRCSVIEWSLDGRGRSTTVIDGEERLELLTTKPKDLSVESCTEVKDLRALSQNQPSNSTKSVVTQLPEVEMHIFSGAGASENLVVLREGSTLWRLREGEVSGSGIRVTKIGANFVSVQMKDKDFTIRVEGELVKPAKTR